MHSQCIVVLVVGTVLLGTYHVAQATQKFVLGINSRNGTLFLHDESSKRKDNTGKMTINSATLKPQPDAQIPTEIAPSHARAIHASEWKEPTPTNWAAIEKKLDADLSSAANVRRWTEKINSISYNNPRKMNRTRQRALVSKSLAIKNTPVRPNPLLMRLIDEENILGVTEKLIARVLAEKTYSKLSDMASTRLPTPDKSNAVVRNKESGTVSQALDELSASILADCKRLFGMMFGRGGEAMTSNENCLRMVGYSVKGKLEGDQGWDETGEGMSYERKDNVNDTVTQEGDAGQRDSTGKQVRPMQERYKEETRTSPQDKKNLFKKPVNTDSVTASSAAGTKNSSAGLITGSDNAIIGQSVLRSSPINLPSTEKVNKNASITDASAISISNSTSNEITKNNKTAAIPAQINITKEASINSFANGGNLTTSANRSAGDLNDQVAAFIASTDIPSLIVNETITRVSSLLKDTSDESQNGAAAATNILKNEELNQNSNALPPAARTYSKVNVSNLDKNVVSNNSSSTTVSPGDVSAISGSTAVTPSTTETQNHSAIIPSPISPSSGIETDNTTHNDSSLPANTSSTTNLVIPVTTAATENGSSIIPSPILSSSGIETANTTHNNSFLPAITSSTTNLVIPVTTDATENGSSIITSPILSSSGIETANTTHNNSFLPANTSSSANLVTPVTTGVNVTGPEISGTSKVAGNRDYGPNENVPVTPNNASSSLLDDVAAASPALQSPLGNASGIGNKTIATIGGSVIYRNITANDHRPEQLVIYENDTNLYVNPTINAVNENTTEEVTEVQDIPSNMLLPLASAFPSNETSSVITTGTATGRVQGTGTAGLLPENRTMPGEKTGSISTNLTAPVTDITDLTSNVPTTEITGASPNNVTPSVFPELSPSDSTWSNNTARVADLAPMNVTSPTTGVIQNVQPDSNDVQQSPAVETASSVVAAHLVPSNSSASIADAQFSPPLGPAPELSAGNVTTFPLYARLFPANLTVPISDTEFNSSGNVGSAFPQGMLSSNMTGLAPNTVAETTNRLLSEIVSPPIAEAGPLPTQGNGSTVVEERTANVFPPSNLAETIPENVTIPISLTEANSLNATSPLIMIKKVDNETSAFTPLLNLASATAPIVSTGLSPDNASIVNTTSPTDMAILEPSFKNVTAFPLYTVVTDNITNATAPTYDNLNGPLLIVNIIGRPYANLTSSFPPTAISPQNQTLPMIPPTGSETSPPTISLAYPRANKTASSFQPSYTAQVDNVNALYLNTSNSSQNNSTMNNSTINTTTTSSNVTKNLDDNSDLEKNVIARFSNRTTEQQYSTSSTNSTNSTEFIGYQLAKSSVPPIDVPLATSSATLENKINVTSSGKTSRSLNRKRFQIPQFPNAIAQRDHPTHTKFRNMTKQRRMFLPSTRQSSRKGKCNHERCFEGRFLLASSNRKRAIRSSNKRGQTKFLLGSRVRTKRSRSLNAHASHKAKKHRIRKTRRHMARCDDNSGNKRRLVSNHVPHHKDVTNQKFKVLSDQKNVGNKSKGAPKTNPTPPPPSQVNNASIINETLKKEMSNDLLSSGKGNRNVRPTLTPLAMPTIAQSGINESRDSVLQKVNLKGGQEMIAPSKEESESYATDDRFPHLGILPHAKAHEGISNDDTHEDPVVRHVPPILGSPPSSNLENLNAPSTPLAPRVDSNNAENQSLSVKEEPTKRILCFGDSLTKGGYAGDQIHHPYTVKLRQLFKENKKGVNYHIINHGMTGDRCVSKKMKQRLTDDLDNLPPLDLVVILAGTEDLIHEDCARDVELFVQLKTLHTLVHDKGYKSAVVTLPESKLYGNGTDRMTLAEYKDAIEDVNQKLRMYAATEKLPLCDLADEFPRYAISGNTRKLENMWDDSVHPNKLGYDRIGEIIYSDIRAYV